MKHRLMRRSTSHREPVNPVVLAPNPSVMGLSKDEQIAKLEAEIRTLEAQRLKVGEMPPSEILGHRNGTGDNALTVAGLLFVAMLILALVNVMAAGLCLVLCVVFVVLGNQSRNDYLTRAANQRSQVIGNIDHQILSKERQLDRLYLIPV